MFAAQRRHQNRFLRLASMLLLVLLLAACGKAPQSPAAPEPAPAPAPKVTIRLGHAGSEQHMWHVWSVKFKEVAEKESNGRIEVQLFPNGQLGREADMAQGVLLGQLEIAAVGVPISQWVPAVAVTDVPFLFRDRAHAYKALDGMLAEKLGQQLKEKGFRLLGWVELGWRHMTSNKGPINSPADLKGAKMRVPESKVYVEMMKALGATVVPVNFSELYLSLQQKLVDGQENPVSTIRAQSFFEVQTYLSLTGHMLSTTYVVTNDKWLQGLDAEAQNIVVKASNEATAHQRKFVADQESETLAFLKEKGMQVNTPADPDSFRTATRGVPDLIKDIVPPDWITQIRNLQ